MPNSFQDPALEALWTLHHARIRNLFIRLLGQDGAEDALQDFFITKAQRVIEKPTAEWGPFLTTCAANFAYDLLRKRKSATRNFEAVTDLERIGDRCADPEEQVLQIERRALQVGRAECVSWAVGVLRRWSTSGLAKEYVSMVVRFAEDRGLDPFDQFRFLCRICNRDCSDYVFDHLVRELPFTRQQVNMYTYRVRCRISELKTSMRQSRGGLSAFIRTK